MIVSCFCFLAILAGYPFSFTPHTAFSQGMGTSQNENTIWAVWRGCPSPDRTYYVVNQQCFLSTLCPLSTRFCCR
jgi:hypothetical protein